MGSALKTEKPCKYKTGGPSCRSVGTDQLAGDYLCLGPKCDFKKDKQLRGLSE